MSARDLYIVAALFGIASICNGYVVIAKAIHCLQNEAYEEATQCSHICKAEHKSMDRYDHAAGCVCVP